MKRDSILFYVNGQKHRVEGSKVFKTLAQYLRRDLQLTGTKIVCEEGDCGACTVLLARFHGVSTLEKTSDPPGPHFQAVNGCIIPLMLLDQTSIVTVEGLSHISDKGELCLNPVQEAMVKHHASQCGFCTPGFVCALTALYEDKDRASEQQIKNALTGNLCRCTGYEGIIEAAQHVDLNGYPKLSDRYASSSMIQSFREASKDTVCIESSEGLFYQPQTLDEALAFMAQHREAQVIAGATDFGVACNKTPRPSPPAVKPKLLSLASISTCFDIRKDGDSVEIGALVTLSQLEKALSTEFAEFCRYLHIFASPQIKNMGTIVGNIANGSPIGDSMPPLLALDAKLLLVSAKEPAGRLIDLKDFYLGYKKRDLRPGELILKLVIPKMTLNEEKFFRVYKVSKRKDLDISSVSAAFCLWVNSQGWIEKARAAFGGIAATPVRILALEEKLVGLALREAQDALTREDLNRWVQPMSDHRGQSEYRKELVWRLYKRYFAELLETPSTHQQTVDQFTRKLEQSDAINPAASAFPSHDSARSHTAGTSLYLEDYAPVRGEVYIALVVSPVAHGELLGIDYAEARKVEGFVAAFCARDLGSNYHNSWGAIVSDQPILASKELHYIGEPIAIVAGVSPQAAQKAARKVVVSVRENPAILSIEEAEKAHSFFLPKPMVIARGDIDEALAASEVFLEGEFSNKGQDHFYLESQSSIVYPGEDGELTIHASTQHPSEVQHQVAHFLGLPLHKVVCTVKRMGGAFGGKESQATHYAALCALAAHKLKRVARLHLTKDEDMAWTGKRHAFKSVWRVGFKRSGEITALKASLLSNGGAYLDLSQPVLQRAMLHVDNAYFIPHLHVTGQICRTHEPPNTAFRGFGGPQGVALMENIIEEIAFTLKMDPLDVRMMNLYGKEERNTTPYGQKISHHSLPELFTKLVADCRYHERQKDIAHHNAGNFKTLRSLSITPVKFGISFTVKHLNQGNALVNVQRDGTVQVSTGATEMGQGVQIKIAQIVAQVFSLPIHAIRIMPTSTEKNHNTSATAASSGTDINGFAAEHAALKIKERLTCLAAHLLTSSPRPDPMTVTEDFNWEKWRKKKTLLEQIQFVDSQVIWTAVSPSTQKATRLQNSISFAELAEMAYLFRVPLGDYGTYQTPGISFDRNTGAGNPFYYFTCGVAASEVSLDKWTGEMKVLQTEILMDLGRPINPGIDRGQVMGAFIQGLGWVGIEDLITDNKGKLLTHSPTTYKIPSIQDIPRRLKIEFLDKPHGGASVRGSKAVGEPPFLLALSVFTAIKQCLQQAQGRVIPLPLPATAEQILSFMPNPSSLASEPTQRPACKKDIKEADYGLR